MLGSGFKESVLHERISINFSCFPNETLETAARYWNELGAKRVSLFTDHLSADRLSSSKSLLEKGNHEVETAVHLFSPGAPLSNRSGWAIAQRRLAEAISGVAEIGGRSIYMLSGSRGSLTWEEAAQAFADALSPCLPLAAERGVALLIEPVGTLLAQHHISHSLRDTVKLAKIIQGGVCLDMFHCWAEAGLRETIFDATPLLGLVQIGDYVLGDSSIPCRAVVGEGDIPIERIVGWILEAGYQGIFDLELSGPRIDRVGRVEAIQRSADTLGKILCAHGA
jgi:sugar phosphate isomerase/epimerase